MRTSAKLTLIALAASVLISAMVSSASARNFSVSNQNIRATWTSLEINAGGVIIRCPAILEGRMHTRTFSKVARSLIGQIENAGITQASCVNGRIAVFNSVEVYNGTVAPGSGNWHITYDSFISALPNIAAVRLAISRFRFGITIPGVCVGEYGNETDNVVLSAAREAGGGITGVTPVAGMNTATLIRRDAGIVCPGTVEMRGTAALMLTGTTTRITITLI